MKQAQAEVQPSEFGCSCLWSYHLKRSNGMTQYQPDKSALPWDSEKNTPSSHPRMQVTWGCG